ADNSDDCSGLGFARCMRQCCRADVGAVSHAAEGVSRAAGFGRGTRENCEAIANGKRASVGCGRGLRNTPRLLERAVPCKLHVSRGAVAVAFGATFEFARSCLYRSSFRSHWDVVRPRARVPG